MRLGKSIPEIKAPRRISMFLSLKQILPYVGILVSIVLIIFQASIIAYAQNVMGKFLMNLVKYETKGKYTIAYDKAKFSLFTSKLSLTNFILHQDSTNLVVSDSSSGINLDASLLSLELNSILEFAFNKKLDVVGLEVINPKIEIFQNRNNSNNEDKQLILQKISAYLKEFKIKELSIQHADLKLTNISPDSTWVIEITDISILINDLIITSNDSLTLFSSENFEVEILNEKQMLNAGHELGFKRLWLSARDSVLYLENLQLHPLHHRQNEYSFYFPKVSFNKIDLRKLIHENIFDAKVMDLGKGTIQIKTGYNVNPKIETSTNKNYPDINISEIILEQTDIDIEFPLQDTTHHLFLRGIDFNLKNLSIDSAKLANPSLLASEIDFTLKLDKYIMDMVRLEHIVSAQNILINYGEGSLMIDSLEIKAHPGKRFGAHNISIPNLSVTGFDAENVVHSGELEVDRIVFFRPIINSQLGSTGNNKIDIDLKNIYPLVQSVFPRLKLNAFDIQNGSINLRNKNNQHILRSQSFNLSLKNILIDSTIYRDREQILGISNIEFSLLNAQINPDENHEIQLGAIEFNSNLGKIDLSDLSLTSRSKFVDQIQLNSFKIRGLDWPSLINEQNFFIDSLLIDEVSIISKVDTVNMLEDSISIASDPFFPDQVKIGLIELKKGTAQLESLKGNLSTFNELRTSIRGLDIRKGDKYMNWTSTSVFVQSGKFSTGIMNGTHQLSGNSISFSKLDSTIRLNQLKLTPLSSAKQNKYDIQIPNLLITGVLPAQLLDSSHLHIKQILVLNPQIELTIQESTQKRSTNNSTSWLNHLELADLKVLNGNLKISVMKDTSVHILSLDRVNMDVREIKYDTSMTTNPFSYFKNIEIKTQSTSYKGFQNIDSLSIGTISINTDNGGSFSDIYLSIKTNQNNMLASVPTLSFYGQNWLQKIYNANYYLDSIVLESPYFNVDAFDAEPLDKNNPPTPFGDTLLVSKINIRNGSFDYQTTDKLYKIPKFDVIVDNLNYQDPFHNSLYSDNIQVSLYNLEDITGSKFNNISLDKLFISTRLQMIELTGFSMQPKYEKMEYGKEFGKQTDWIQLQNNKIRFTGVNFNKFLDHNFLELEYVEVDSVSMHVFRDKNIPFPEDQVRYMPQQMLRNVEIPFDIRNVSVNSLNVIYEELAPDATEAGEINFTGLTATMRNVTNDSAAIAKDSIMYVKADSRIMDAGDVHIQIEYDLLSVENGHSYIGQLGYLDLTKLNLMLEPNVNIQIKSGELQKMDLRVTGNDHYSTGIMNMLYNDLHIRVINKKTDQPKGMGPAFVTFFANTFVINRNNRSLIAREGDIYAERDTARSVFNYLSSTALSGVISSIGARNNRKEIKKLNKEAKEIKDKKRERMLRKEEKKEQKQEKKSERKSDGNIENKEN